MNPLTDASTQADDISPEEAQQLLDRVLQQGHMTEAEFDLSLEINAYLRKISEPVVRHRRLPMTRCMPSSMPSTARRRWPAISCWTI